MRLVCALAWIRNGLFVHMHVRVCACVRVCVYVREIGVLALFDEAGVRISVDAQRVVCVCVFVFVCCAARVSRAGGSGK